MARVDGNVDQIVGNLFGEPQAVEWDYDPSKGVVIVEEADSLAIELKHSYDSETYLRAVQFCNMLGYTLPSDEEYDQTVEYLDEGVRVWLVEEEDD